MNYYLLSEQDLDELAWEIEDFNLFLGVGIKFIFLYLKNTPLNGSIRSLKKKFGL